MRPTPSSLAPITDRERGFALVDALAALAFVALIALGSAQLLHQSLSRVEEARRLRDATTLAGRVLDELSLVGWHGLPGTFGAEESSSAAFVDSARGDLPERWQDALVAHALPGGRMIVTIEGLGAGGAPSRFADSLALRLSAELSWDEARARRRVRLVTGRF